MWSFTQEVRKSATTNSVNDGDKQLDTAGRAVGIHWGMTEQSCDTIHQADTVATMAR